ncbi:MAG: HNH endonuclease signature motif containing protein [Chloroflexota bacterium]|nr:HNH endonuclease signature motif containing protein [Chloroflexota bacterium]
MIVVFVVGALVWALVPRHILYPVIGVAVVVIVAVCVLLYRRQGLARFKSLARRSTQAIAGDRERAKTTSSGGRNLSAAEKERFKEAAGYSCENPACRERDLVDLHHIIPREQGGSNRKDNLIVLCPTCHRKADRGVYPRVRLRQWISEPSRKAARDALDWPY